MDSLMQPLVEPWAHLSQRGERQDAEARGAHADAVPGEEVAQNSRPQSGPQPQGSQQAEPLQGDVVRLAAGSPTTVQQSSVVPSSAMRGQASKHQAKGVAQISGRGTQSDGFRVTAEAVEGRGEHEDATLLRHPDEQVAIFPIGARLAVPAGGLEGTPPEHDGTVRERRHEPPPQERGSISGANNPAHSLKICGVRSVEPSSRMTNSKLPKLWRTILSMLACR